METADGHSIRTGAIVLATDSPCNHNLAVHARQLAYRSYAIGLLIPKDKYKRALYWDTGASRPALPAGLPASRTQLCLPPEPPAPTSSAEAAAAVAAPAPCCAAEPYHYVRIDEWDDSNYLLIVGA